MQSVIKHFLRVSVLMSYKQWILEWILVQKTTFVGVLVTHNTLRLVLITEYLNSHLTKIWFYTQPVVRIFYTPKDGNEVTKHNLDYDLICIMRPIH